MKTLIAIPCMDTMHHAFVRSLLNLDKPAGTSVCIKPNSLVYDSRNLLAITAFENDFDYVMWIDSDMTFGQDTLNHLLEDIQNTPEAEMVTTLCVQRTMPTRPVIYDRIGEPDLDENGQLIKSTNIYFPYPKDQIFPVEGCGFGCCITSVNLLRKVWDKFGPAFAPYNWAGEDVSFCYRVQKLGYKIFCDSRIKCGHIGTYIYTDKLLEEGDDA